MAANIDRLVDAGRKSASIRRAVAGIASIHQLNNVVDPTKQIEARLAMRRMHRKLGRFSHQAQGIRKDILKKCWQLPTAHCGESASRHTPVGIRNTVQEKWTHQFRIEDIYRRSIETECSHLTTSIFKRN